MNAYTTPPRPLRHAACVATAALLLAALALASHRVVVKRPRKAPIIEGAKPSYALEGKSSRYDIYPKKALKPQG